MYLYVITMDYGAASIRIRESSGGQIEVCPKGEIRTTEDLSIYYSPGIAAPCQEITKDPARADILTIRRDTIAVISNGTAVLGLGNIGAKASLPVMEGKCMLFKQFGGVNAFPIVVKAQDTETFIQTVVNIADTFGGINLEDIAAPACFEIERRLTELLDIPVFHDDQHGTAICVLAALQNALKVTGKEKETLQVVIVGSGAAGVAIAELLKYWGLKHIVLVDSKGIVACSREDLNEAKRQHCVADTGDLAEAVKGKDVFIGVSKGGLLTPEMVQSMNKDPIIFALANPIPEIFPEEAKKAGAAVCATGRSDLPNQINNVLVFPGFFKGLLQGRIRRITVEMKLEAARALAALIPNPTPEKIIPSPLTPGVAEAVAKAVMAVGRKRA